MSHKTEIRYHGEIKFIRKYKHAIPLIIYGNIYMIWFGHVEKTVTKSRFLAKYKRIRSVSLILCILSIMSTMFIKQHSVFDVTTALIMAALIYDVVYRFEVLITFCQNLQKHHKRKPGIS